MVFSSLEFLFLYLPAVIAVYHIAPPKFKNFALFLASLVFLGRGGPLCPIVALAALALSYALGFLVAGPNPKGKKVLVAAAVLINLAPPVYFQYANASGMATAVMAFCGLRLLSYIFDVYAAKSAPQRNLVSLGLYAAMFPQIPAGPVCKYRAMEEKLSRRAVTLSMFARGSQTFICGLCKKLLFADTAAAIFRYIKALPGGDITVVGAWFGLFAFFLYIYFELSGYCDMAVGLGRMFGFEFPESFDYPYMSKSVSEFCRRFHMTLSGWSKEYLSDKCDKFDKKALAVCLGAGLWLGANAKWNYIIFALYLGAVLALEKIFAKKTPKLPAFVGHIYTWAVLLFAWLIFAFEDMQKGWSYLGRLFGLSAKGFIDAGAVYDVMRYLPFLALALVGCTPLPKKLFHRFSGVPVFKAAALVVSAALFLVCAAFLIDSAGSSPFMR